MTSVLISVLTAIRGLVRSRVALHVEVPALRHQLMVLQRSRPRRLRLVKADRWLWVRLSRSWIGWREALVIVKPETVIAWHRRGFRLYQWAAHDLEVLRGLLHRLPNAPLARQRLAPIAADQPTRPRPSHRLSASWRTPSSIPTSRGIKRLLGSRTNQSCCLRSVVSF